MQGLRVLAVLPGSALWWLTPCTAEVRLRHRFCARARQGAGHLSALMPAASALWQRMTLVWEASTT